MNCFLCNKPIYNAVNKSQKFCGLSCRTEYFGEFKFKQAKGLVCRNEKPFCHRTLYRKTHGAIPSGWHVHHIDFNHSNNVIENLIAVPARMHHKIHAEGLRTRKEIEALLVDH